MNLYVVHELDNNIVEHSILGIFTKKGLEDLKNNLWERYIHSDNLKCWYENFDNYFNDNYKITEWVVNPYSI